MTKSKRLTMTQVIRRRTEEFYRFMLKRHFSITPQLEEKFEKDLHLICDFLSYTDVPLWYRGKSQFQFDAADNLAYAIRDDTEQGTTHRVRRCLISIGMQPMVSRSKIKLLIHLCKGNDLALLWFLMELYYKTPTDIDYTVNEQLILSTIAHLDMVTTLRELDRILPPGNKACSKVEQKRRLEQSAAAAASVAAERQRAKTLKKQKEKDPFPYFHKLEKPLQISPKRGKRPPFKASLQTYSEYLDPNYLPPNENNRWFSNYELNCGARVAKRIVFDLVGNICELLDRCEVREGMDANTNKTALQEVSAIVGRNVCCAKHAQTAPEKKQRKMCEVPFELFSQEKKLRLQRVLEQLNRDVNAFRICSENQKNADPEWCRRVRVLGKDGSFCEYLIPDLSSGSCVHSEGAKKCRAERTTDVSELQDSGKTDEQKPQADKRHATPGGDADSERAIAIDKVRTSFVRQVSQRTSSILTGEHPQFARSKRVGSSDRYFEKPSANKPYKFDYHKIYKYKDPNDLKFFIKDECLKALGGDVYEAIRLDDYTPNLLLAAEKCATKIWEEAIAEWREQHEVSSQQQQSQADVAASPYPPGIPIRDCYDCDDANLMASMLKAALNHMANDRRFVLASLPDSYKYPFLRQWMLERYGKQYTRKDQREMMNETLKILAALEKTPFRVPAPTMTNLAQVNKLDYTCRNFLLRKSDELKKEYQDRVTAALMEHTRIYWLALRPFLCSTARQRLSFFSYLPPREADLHLFRVWRHGEYRDIKRVWDDRQYQRKRKQASKIL